MTYENRCQPLHPCTHPVPLSSHLTWHTAHAQGRPRAEEHLSAYGSLHGWAGRQFESFACKSNTLPAEVHASSLLRPPAQGLLVEPKEEAVSRAEMVEACFRHLQREHRGLPRPGPYYHSYLQWLKEGLPPWQAYTERSALHALANCWLQARTLGHSSGAAVGSAAALPNEPASMA